MDQTVYRPIAGESKAIAHYSASSAISAAQRNSAVAAGDGYSIAIRQPCQYNLTGDLNNDCKVNFRDFCTMMDNWLTNCYQSPDDPACVPKESTTSNLCIVAEQWCLDSIY